MELGQFTVALAYRLAIEERLMLGMLQYTGNELSYTLSMQDRTKDVGNA